MVIAMLLSQDVHKEQGYLMRRKWLDQGLVLYLQPETDKKYKREQNKQNILAQI